MEKDAYVCLNFKKNENVKYRMRKGKIFEKVEF